MTDASVLMFRAERGEEVEDVLCDAFREYPVMRHVLGEPGADDDARLRRLVHLFVSARLLSGHPIYAIEDAGELVAVGTTTPPGKHPRLPEFQALRDATWAELGGDALKRYEEIVAVWEGVAFPEPHLHINMLGTRRTHAGKGLGRRILEAVQQASRERPATVGVSLTTEDPNNVPMYEHCGYKVIHHARVTDSMETWLLFRPNDLDTDRLTLRWAADDDAPFFLELLNDSDWIRFIGDRGVRTLDAARGYIADKLTASYIRHGFGLYVAVERASGDPVGICGLIRRDGLEDVDVGFAMLPRFRGKGYALEATRAVMDQGRDVFGLRRMVAITIPDNRGSIRVLERAGMTHERTIRLPDDDSDLALYGWDADR